MFNHCNLLPNFAVQLTIACIIPLLVLLHLEKQLNCISKLILQATMVILQIDRINFITWRHSMRLWCRWSTYNSCFQSVASRFLRHRDLLSLYTRRKTKEQIQNSIATKLLATCFIWYLLFKVNIHNIIQVDGTWPRVSDLFLEIYFLCLNFVYICM